MERKMRELITDAKNIGRNQTECLSLPKEWEKVQKEG